VTTGRRSTFGRGALGLALLLAALVAPCALRADVGYNPQALGQATAKWYTKDATGKLQSRSALINFAAVPSTFTGPATEAQFDARWGTGSFRRFRWQGLDNESRLSVKAAMEWACNAGRGDLLGWRSGRPPGVSCVASEVEVVDALAVGYGGTLGAAHQVAEGAAGTTPELAIPVRDSLDKKGLPRPAGLFSERDPTWPLTRWYLNTVTASTVPTPVDPHPVPDPEPPVTPTQDPATEERLAAAEAKLADLTAAIGAGVRRLEAAERSVLDLSRKDAALETELARVEALVKALTAPAPKVVPGDPPKLPRPPPTKPGAKPPLKDPLAAFPADRRGSAEIWGPIWLLHLSGVQPVDEPAQAQLQKLADAHAAGAGARALARLMNTDGSWNVPFIDLAVRLFEGRPGARSDWIKLLKWQLRDEPPPTGSRFVDLLGGSESVSANYAPWRAGAVGGVWLWAVRNGDEELAELVRRYTLRAAALATLLSTEQVPDGELGRNKKGELLATSRHMASVSNRSNPAHAWTASGTLLDLVLGRGTKLRRQPEWFFTIIEAANDARPMIRAEDRAVLERYFREPMASGASEDVARLVSPSGIHGTIRVLWWDGYRAVILDKRLNGNTPAIMFEGFDLRTGKVFMAYPWPEGRCFKCGGQATAGWRPGALWTTSPFSEITYPAPANDPTVEIVIDGQGARVTRRAA
jgi:hypothetical protein